MTSDANTLRYWLNKSDSHSVGYRNESSGSDNYHINQINDKKS